MPRPPATPRTQRTARPFAARPACRMCRGASRLVVSCQAEKAAVVRADYVVATRPRGERPAAHPVLADAVQIVVRVDRHQILVLPELSLALERGVLQVEIDVRPAPGIGLAGIGDRGQGGRILAPIDLIL